jgi:hypothetical protein
MTALRKLGSKGYRLARSYSRPSHLVAIARQACGRRGRLRSDGDHLAATIAWLCRSQDVVGGSGSSSGYFFETGWGPPYPETTGYIIPTFLRYGDLCGDDAYVDRAVSLGDWEIDIQLASGAVRGGQGINDYPIVFNTGQVILGWCSLYRVTQEKRFLDAATDAANWLLAVQDADGKWRKHTFMDMPHAYHTRVAWSLLETHRLTADERFRGAAERNIAWTLSCARSNGWIERMGFTLEEPPLTHTIAYTLRGLLESSALLANNTGADAESLVMRAADKTLRHYELNKRTPEAVPGYLAASFKQDWQPAHTSSCLVGNAQIAILWLKIYERTKDARFLNGALKMLDHVKWTQDLSSHNPGIRGGIAGSYPIWGPYLRLAYPNWAAKFFADALMMQESLMKTLETGTSGDRA